MIWAPGGIASYIRLISDAQRARGYYIRYLSLSDAEKDERGCVTVRTLEGLFEAAKDLDVLHVHQEVDGLLDCPTPVLRSMHENQASCPTGSRFLRERSRPCDRKAGLICLWGLAVDRCGSVKPESVRRYYERYRIDRRILPHIHTHTVSEFLRTNMIRAGYPGEMIHTLLHPAPVRETESADDLVPLAAGRPRFLFMGRVVPSKGVHWLLRSVAAGNGSYDVDIAGDGHVLDAMKELADSLGVADRVRFHGWLRGDALQVLLEQSRAVVFPSLWHEPAGLVTVEAAAAGRAVIASRVGGIPEYATREFARIVTPNDVRGLAEAMDELSANAALASRLGRQGREIVRRSFRMDDYLDNLEGLYQLAIRDTRAG